MASAASRVFNIAELCGQILCELHALEERTERLFILQQVNHGFRTAINASPQLLQAMGIQRNPHDCTVYYPPHAADALHPIFLQVDVHPQAKLFSATWTNPHGL